MRHRFKVGEVIGKWEILELRGSKSWCRCSCGTEREVHHSGLYGRSMSCGCSIPQGPRYNRRNPDRNHVRNILLFNKAKSNAKRDERRGELEFSLGFELTIELMTSPCHYCGDSGSNSLPNRSTGEVWKYNGIDRLDSNYGYIETNVVPCCKVCNIMKRDLSKEAFLSHIALILQTVPTGSNITRV